MNPNPWQCFAQCNGEGRRNKTRMPLAEKAFQSLSTEEKDRIYGEIYGTEEPMDESPEFIRNKLADLDKELGLLNEGCKKYYTRAVQIEKQQQLQSLNNNIDESSYVTHPKFLLMFLRADRFDARQAARRLARYFAEKIELFGEDKLACRIKQEDFVHHEDKKALISGGISYIGAKDRAGRAVLMIRRDQLFQENFISLKRAVFYMFQIAIEDNEVSQRKGLVLVGYHMHALPFARPSDVRVIFPTFRMMLNAIPVRFSGLHSCYCDFKDHCIYNLILVLFPRDVRARFHCHYQESHVECMLKLMSLGISPKSLPLTDEGKFRHDVLWEYLHQQRQLEGDQDHCRSM